MVSVLLVGFAEPTGACAYPTPGVTKGPLSSKCLDSKISQETKNVVCSTRLAQECVPRMAAGPRPTDYDTRRDVFAKPAPLQDARIVGVNVLVSGFSLKTTPSICCNSRRYAIVKSESFPSRQREMSSGQRAMYRSSSHWLVESTQPPCLRS